MNDSTTEPVADESPFRLTRRQLTALAAGLAIAGPGISLSAVARHDDHDDEDDSDDNRGHDDDDRDSGHDDDDSDDHRDDDDDPGAAPVQLADGSWEVRITDDDADAFLPGSLTILPGETVTWVNNDDKPHTATGGNWDTGSVEPGASVSITFDQAGSFAYACQFHPVMTGTVIVGNANATPAASPIASPTTGEIAVRIFNLAYEPAALEVPAGATVSWTNDDTLTHTVTSDDGLFDSNSLASGATFEQTFETAGEYPYSCAFHPGMRGTVTVV